MSMSGVVGDASAPSGAEHGSGAAGWRRSLLEFTISVNWRRQIGRLESTDKSVQEWHCNFRMFAELVGDSYISPGAGKPLKGQSRRGS